MTVAMLAKYLRLRDASYDEVASKMGLWPVAGAASRDVADCLEAPRNVDGVGKAVPYLAK